MSSAAGQKTVRKFPPPCWTRDEALVLIEAYRERWYALHRAFLRTPDWDAVAEKLTATCPHADPPKTSAQCRHKMEKLRQRHRAERQRAAAFPGERFLSNWFYYEAMEAMENGSSNEPGSQGLNNPGQGTRVKPVAVQTFAALAPDSSKRRAIPNPNFTSRVSNRYSSSNQDDGYGGYEDGYEEPDPSLVETPIGYRGKEAKSHKLKKPKPFGDESGRPGLRPRKFSKIVVDDDVDDEDEGEDEMWIKVPRRRSANSGRGKPRGRDYSKPKGKGKKKDGGIGEVVNSIRLLGEGFMKVEKMKIEMAMEIEEMRMESEMKRNQMMLESQKQIVGAFVEGLIKFRNVPRTTTMALAAEDL